MWCSSAKSVFVCAQNEIYVVVCKLHQYVKIDFGKYRDEMKEMKEVKYYFYNAIIGLMRL